MIYTKWRDAYERMRKYIEKHHPDVVLTSTFPKDQYTHDEIKESFRTGQPLEVTDNPLDAPDWFERDDNNNKIPLPRTKKIMWSNGCWWRKIEPEERIGYQYITGMGSHSQKPYWFTNTWYGIQISAPHAYWLIFKNWLL